MEAANALAKEAGCGLQRDKQGKLALLVTTKSWDRWIEEEGGAVVDDITVAQGSVVCATFQNKEPSLLFSAQVLVYLK